MPPVRGGPSPLTRGNPRPLARIALPGGTIPAHAGEPAQCHSILDARRDHPRSRGGTAETTPSDPIVPGPSPLTRGNLIRIGRTTSATGTIPAHAGEPACGITPDAVAQNHPRSRGGSRTPVMPIWNAIGPSPLTRGNLIRGIAKEFSCGTIPAHAGEPRGHRWCSSLFWDHPRSRGGTSACRPPTKPSPGPSPLTRGNRKAVEDRLFVVGTIPAHAGEPASRRG